MERVFGNILRPLGRSLAPGTFQPHSSHPWTHSGGGFGRRCSKKPDQRALLRASSAIECTRCRKKNLQRKQGWRVQFFWVCCERQSFCPTQHQQRQRFAEQLHTEVRTLAGQSSRGHDGNSTADGESKRGKVHQLCALEERRAEQGKWHTSTKCQQLWQKRTAQLSFSFMETRGKCTR